MKHFFNPTAHIATVLRLLKWCGLIIPPAILAGSASALFLWGLEKVTALRWEHGWLLWFLPVAGVGIGFIYHFVGRSVEGGNNLIMDEIHEPGGGVPARMTPLIFVATLVTHLFGGSAGREGTAVQMGGSIASWFSQVFRIRQRDRRVLLMAGIAAGFGSVFGTPLTGAVFAMEVLTVGRMQYDAIIPVLIASMVGDLTCSAWGIRHAIYHIQFQNAEPSTLWHVDLLLLAKVVFIGALFGLAGQFFAELTHGLHKTFKRLIPYSPLRPILGGVLVIAGVYLLSTRDYLGMGDTSPDPGAVTIHSAFQPDGAHPLSWLWKAIFTAVTLSSGFKGGEVTPLFFIGATLGNTLAWLLNAPVDLFAALGFVAVFAGSTNTPLACTIMGIELFGAQHTAYFATACFVSYFFSGHSGIYLSQRVGIPKQHLDELPADIPLREARELSQELNTLKSEEIFRFLEKADPHKPTTAAIAMPHQHKITITEMGKIRIYLTPTEKISSAGIWGKINPKRLYQEIIDAAKRDGLMNAIAYTGHHGFSNKGDVQIRQPEVGNGRLPMCVELVDRKDKLEEFCRKHGELLKGKAIIYKHVEHWSLQAHELLEKEADPKEYLTDEE